jgi:hypothetical protein
MSLGDTQESVRRVNNSDERRRCERAVSLGQDQILSRLPDLAPRRLE